MMSAIDDTDELLRSESQERLRRAQERIQERNSGGRNVIPVRQRNRRNSTGDGEDESGGQPRAGGAKGSRKGQKSNEGVLGYDPPTSGQYSGSLADGRENNVGSKSAGGRTARVSEQRPYAGGQTTRPKDAILEAVEGRVKRVLAYAGFDVKGDAEGLSEYEREKLKPQVALFFQRVGIALDWGVTHSNRAQEESDIWMFTDEEADTLAVIYLKRASKIGWMAQVARQVQHLEDVGDAKDVAAIVGKRIIATGMFYGSNGGFHPWMNKSIE